MTTTPPTATRLQEKVDRAVQRIAADDEVRNVLAAVQSVVLIHSAFGNELIRDVRRHVDRPTPFRQQWCTEVSSGDNRFAVVNGFHSLRVSTCFDCFTEGNPKVIVDRGGV